MLRSKVFVSFSNRAAILAAGACFALLSAAPALRAQISTSISSGSALPGGTVSLNINKSTSGSDQAAALQWSMSYPAADIASVSITTGGAASGSGKSLTCSPAGPNTTCIVYGMNQDAIGDGPVAVATFTLASNITGNSIPIQISNTVAADGTGSSLADQGASGAIAVTPAIPQVGLLCSSTSISTPGTTSCSVSITSALPSAVTVGLAASNPALSLPSSVTIPAGSMSTSFTATAAAVTTGETVTISALGGSNSPTMNLSLMPAASLTGFACSASSISTPGTTSCLIILGSPAPANNFSVALSSNNPALNTPASVSVPMGSLSANFTVSAASIGSNQQAMLTATAGTSSQTVSLTLMGSSGQNFDPAKTYELVNRNSGKVLDITGETTASAARVDQSSWAGANSQKWRFVSTGDGYFSIVNVNSGKVLDASGQGTWDGTPVIQWDWWGGDNQRWQLVSLNNGYYNIVNKNANKVLDVEGQSMAEGGVLIIYDNWGGPNQQWQLVPVQ